MSVVFDLILPLGGATVAGLAIGAEREHRGQAAGLRTHALLCVGCCLLMLLSGHGVGWVGPRSGLDLDIDPGRAVQGVLAGIGFVCGGVIFRSGVSIHGLTTAASLWCVTVLGMAFGAERYGIGVIGTVLLLALLSVAKWADAHMPKTTVVQLAVRFRPEDSPGPEGLRRMLHEHQLKCERVSHALDGDPATIELSTTVRAPDARRAEDLGERLAHDPRVVSFTTDLRHG